MSIDVPFLGKKYQGKVRDYYIKNSTRILITTDRISAFDKILGLIPYKGQVLNQLSEFWFDQTKDLVINHKINVPHANVMIAKEATPYPIEMVVRGYLTGVTTTSIWYSYSKGERTIYGFKFPDGLKKNQKLPQPLITPTTKAEHGKHDQRLTREEILQKKLVDAKVLENMESISLALYKRGNDICRKHGLILVDTKYEFADFHGRLMLIDEIHTPDSSRFWKEDNYQKRFKSGGEPENLDKEFLRLWYAKKGYIGDGNPPPMSADLQIKTALRYIKIFEIITGKKFKPEKYPAEEKIIKVLKKEFSIQNLNF